MDEDNTKDDVEKRTISTLAGTPVSWHAALEQVPSGFPTIIVAHEFYDALPVHKFQRTTRGWCEKLVDVAEDSSLPLQFSFCCSASSGLQLKNWRSLSTLRFAQKQWS